MRITKKEITLKSIAYRIFVIVYELILANFLAYIGINSLSSFVLLNNTIKIIGYMLFEMVWFGYLRTRLNVVRKFKEKFSVKEEG